MKKSTVSLIAAAVLAAASALPASAASVVNVYVGYLNNINGSPDPLSIPTPFDSSATTTLISSGDSSTSHDTGIIRFENTSSQSVTIGPFVGAFAGAFFQPWGLLGPFVLEAGHNLVLAETANYNFDSSDFGLSGGTPQIFTTINGHAYGFDDVHRVLYGHEDAVDFLETTPYDLIGSVEVAAVPVPGASLLMGSALVGFVSLARRRRAA